MPFVRDCSIRFRIFLTEIALPPTVFCDRITKSAPHIDARSWRTAASRPSTGPTPRHFETLMAKRPKSPDKHSYPAIELRYHRSNGEAPNRALGQHERRAAFVLLGRRIAPMRGDCFGNILRGLVKENSWKEKGLQEAH